MYEALSNPFKRTISGNSIRESIVGTKTVLAQVQKNQTIKSARGPTHPMLPSPTEAGPQRTRVYSNKFTGSFQTNQGYLISQEDRLNEDYSYDPNQKGPL